MFQVLPKQTKSMFTRDGVRLDSDIYYPDSPGEFPILLMRHAYNKKTVSIVVYAHPKWYASHGYIVVIQDVRGRGTSEGEFNLFINEINDGFDTLNWVANLPQSNGKVAMYGFSYQAMTQLYAASQNHPSLITICPAMMGYNLYADWGYENNAFCLQTNLSWAIQLATETAKLKGDETTYQELLKLGQNLPLYDKIASNPDIFKKLAPDSFYHQWLENDQPGEYWQNLSPNLTNVDLPMLHIGGWFDTYLRGNLRLYEEMSAKSKYRQQLIIGHWSHLPWGRKVGNINYGLEGQSFIDKFQIRWFDHLLKNQDTGLLAENHVLLFEMNSNKWRSLPNFSQNNQQSFYLTSTGLANIREDEGFLQEKPEITDNIDILIHVPWRSIPSFGGHNCYPSGSCDRSTIDCRTDIIKYTTLPLAKDLYIMGDVILEIYAESENPSFDLAAILSEVKLDGSVYNFSQGYIKINQPENQINKIRFKLQSTCIKIPEKHSLRLSVSGAYFPAYPINSGTVKPTKSSHWIENEIITINIYSGGEFTSKLLLSI